MSLTEQNAVTFPHAPPAPHRPTPITTPPVRRALSRGVNNAIAHVPLTTPRDYTRAIIKDIAHRHGLRPEDIFARNRTAPLVAARHEAIVAVHLARPFWSYPELGRYFGLDHTTVMHALEQQGLELGRTTAARKLRQLCCDLAAFATTINLVTSEAAASWLSSEL